jgi:hypothetical protein
MLANYMIRSVACTINIVTIVKYDTSALYYKCFMIVIYDRNDSGQYSKTRITIVIDNPS